MKVISSFYQKVTKYFKDKDLLRFIEVTALVITAIFTVYSIAYQLPQNYKTTQRPYVLVEGMTIVKQPGSDELHFLLSIKNTGLTPALEMRSTYSIEKTKTIPEIPSDTLSTMNLGAGSERTSTTPLESQSLRSEDILNKDNDFYIVTLITYNDIFNDEHKTIVCGHAKLTNIDTLEFSVVSCGDTNEMS